MIDFYENGRWVTKDGQVLRIEEMTDEHRRNCANLLLRWAMANQQAIWWDCFNAGWEALGSVRGEMAYDSIESAWKATCARSKTT